MFSEPLWQKTAQRITMPENTGELGRIDLGDITPHNIKLLRKVNTVVFPVSYHDKFYKVSTLIYNEITSILKICYCRMCLTLGNWPSWYFTMILLWEECAAGLMPLQWEERFVFTCQSVKGLST